MEIKRLFAHNVGTMLRNLLAALISNLRAQVGRGTFILNLVVHPKQIWNSSKRKNEIFWDRVEQSRLMLSRLNDNDISSYEAENLINRIPDTKYGACCLIHHIYAAISSKASALEDRGFELDRAWIANSASASRHISRYIYTALSDRETEYFFEYMLSVTKDLVRDPEILFAWASGD